MKNFIYLFLIQTLILNHAFSQNDSIKNSFSISGAISDSIENCELAYVNMSLLNSKDSSFFRSGHTLENGKYTIENIPENEYILRVNYIGYNPILKKIKLTSNINLNLYLTKSDLTLENITVIANKEIYSLETDKRVYFTKNDESIQNAFAENAIENAPGVYINVEGNIIIRGQAAKVWINGKPSKRKGENLKSFLRLLPASRIEKIEVITNPSARYTATNTNSIVNIVIKKKLNNNSLFAIGTVINTAGVYGIWGTTYITRKKFDINIYAIGAVSSRKLNFYDKSFSTSNQDTTFFTSLKKKQSYEEIWGKIYGEFTYHINTNTDIGINFEYYKSEKTNSFENENIRRHDNPNRIETSVKDKLNPETYDFSLNFNHDFKKPGHNLYIEFYSFKAVFKNSYSKTENYNLSNTETYWNSRPNNDILSVNFSLNYTYPINDKYVFETGINCFPINNESKERIIETSSNTNNDWIMNPNLSYDYFEKNPTYEFYTTFTGKFYSLKYKLGLRYEHSIYNLSQSIQNYIINKKYNNLYPSIHLSYQTKLRHNFSLSYSRRVNTPVYNLNPYIDRSNTDFINSGNSNLNFAATNSYEFSYFKRFKKINLTVSVYHRNTKRDIVQVSEPVYDDYFAGVVTLQS